MNFSDTIKNFEITFKQIFSITKKNLLKAPLINIYKTDFKKNVLICYITKPFRKKINYSHTNLNEAIIISKIFSELNFNVDVVDYDFNGFINFEKYDVVFGFGDSFTKSFYNRNKKIITIFYATGMHFLIQNYNSLKRIEEVFRKKNKLHSADACNTCKRAVQ